MRVLALTPSPVNTAPGQRFRIEQWEPLLNDGGVEIVYSPFVTSALQQVLHRRGQQLTKAARLTSAFVRQIARAREASRFDLVYVFREASLIGPAWIERWVARQGLPVVFDFDDATFVSYASPANGYWSYLKFPSKTATLCRSARQVMAGNAYLADYASRYNDEVTIIPTTIDTDLYRPEPARRATDRVTIGWTGSFSTARCLQFVAPALSELSRRHSFRLVVIGADPPELPGVEVEARPWRAETEVEDLSDIDIGIMPLPDEEWTRGKCGLKALQYMALGVPAVVSPVGVNTEIVSEGTNGLLAGDDTEWVDKLSTLIERPELRKRLGAEARKTVEKRYSARVVAPLVCDLFRRAATPR